MTRLAPYRKTVTALCGVAADALALGLVPAPYDRYVTAGLAVATAVGVYAVPNGVQPPGKVTVKVGVDAAAIVEQVQQALAGHPLQVAAGAVTASAAMPAPVEPPLPTPPSLEQPAAAPGA